MYYNGWRLTQPARAFKSSNNARFLDRIEFDVIYHANPMRVLSSRLTWSINFVFIPLLFVADSALTIAVWTFSTIAWGGSWIVLSLRTPTQFGRRIFFHARWRSGWIGGQHPTAIELRTLAGLKA